MVYDLNAWPTNPTHNFEFKNYLFEANSMVKNSDKQKYVYSGSGITFGSKGSRSFNNDIARNAIIFGVNINSSSYASNHNNNFLVLGEGTTFGINERFGSPEKKFRINFSKSNAKFYFSLL